MNINKNIRNKHGVIRKYGGCKQQKTELHHNSSIMNKAGNIRQYTKTLVSTSDVKKKLTFSDVQVHLKNSKSENRLI